MTKKIKRVISFGIVFGIIAVLPMDALAECDSQKEKNIIGQPALINKEIMDYYTGDVKTIQDNIGPGIVRTIEDQIQNKVEREVEEKETHITTVSYEIQPYVVEQNLEFYNSKNTSVDVLRTKTVNIRSGSNYVEEDACGWRILVYSTIEWNKRIINGNTYMGITKTYGGVKSKNGFTGANQGGGVILKTGNVTIKQNGMGEQSLVKNQSKIINTIAAPHSWSFTPPSSWQYIYVVGMGIVSISETVNYTINNGNTYSLSFPNTLFLDGSIVV